jgi:hypothetical protein
MLINIEALELRQERRFNMYRDIPLYRRKLSKKFFMQLSEGLYLVSNLFATRYESLFAEEVSSQRYRERQWQRIVRAGVNDRICNVFRTDEDYRFWLVDLDYSKDLEKRHTIH